MEIKPLCSEKDIESGSSFSEGPDETNIIFPSYSFL